MAQFSAKASIVADRQTRMFDLAPGARTGLRRRDGTHWMYVVAGSGFVERAGGPISLKRGTLIVIQSNERHEIVNDGVESLRAISMHSADAENPPRRRWLGGTLAASTAIVSSLAAFFYRLVG